MFLYVINKISVVLPLSVSKILCYLCTDMSLFLQGIVYVFEDMNERMKHRLCLRHLYVNFKKNLVGEH